MLSADTVGRCSERLPVARRGGVPAGVRRRVLRSSPRGSCPLASCPATVCRQALLFAVRNCPGSAFRLGVLVGPSAEELGWVRFSIPTGDGPRAFAAGQGGETAGKNVPCPFLCSAGRGARGGDGEDCAGSGGASVVAPPPLGVRDGADTDCAARGSKSCGGDACGGPDATGTNGQASACKLLALSSLDVRDGVGEDGSACGGAGSGENRGGDACGGTAASSGWTPHAGSNGRASGRSLLAPSAFDVSCPATVCRLDLI